MRALFLTVLVLCLYFTEGETKTCYTLDIRNNVTELEQLENCTIIAGNLQIVLINQSHSFEGYSFPELREITDYLLFYRLYNLYSIGQLFPNLAVIRGQNIFINYALVIYELRDLTEIGLYSLVRISRGSVRIEKNPSLNYAHTINWDVITGGNKQAVIEKQDESYSSSCPSECGKYCWNNNECQRLIDKECHPACLSGCPGRNDNECEVCVNYEEDGKCVMKCNDDRLLAPLLFKCITKEECRALGDEWLIFGKECVTSCPPKYKKQNDTCVFCNLLCPKICEGTEVQDIDTLQKLKGCTNITGALHIRFDTHIKNLEYELEENLGNIEEITGYLKVYRNIQLRNLTFFKNLTMIRGEKVDQDRYSLVVHENPNLQNLWDWENFNMNISNGTFMFHFNPKLCLSEIERLANLTHLKTKFSNIDVSNYTNGDNFACTHIDIEVNEVAVFENNVTLEWRPLSSQDRNLATQFLIYYKEVEDTEPETDEESCGVASWMITFVSRVENDAYSTYQWNITNLKVFTKYEYYVRSDYIKGGRSLLKYFTTKSGDPSVPMNVQTKPIGSDAIKLTWEVPINLNGNLSYYNILGYIQEDNQDFIDDRNYCKVKVKPKKQTYIETTTPAPILNNTCACKKESIINIIQERDFDAICTDLDKHKPRGSHSQGCGTFAYQVIPSNLKLQEEIDKRETSTESSATTTTDKDKIKDLKEDGIYRAFGRQANANETSFIMRQLKHFSIYILFLEACNENETAEPLCSSVVMVSQRTGRKPGADDIQDVTISKETNFIVDIGWYEVNNPNAVIVSYDIEYQNMNLDNSKIISHCITRKEHEKNNFKYRIENLSPGKYRVNVRANSLAGPGNFSAEKTFLITYPPQISTVMWFIIAFIFLFVLGAAIVILYYRYNIRHNLDNMHLIASVNPDYAGYREDEWEIDRENLEIFQELGQGTFGTVYSGTIKNQNVACAIKTVHENATMHDLMEFLNEATVMKSFNEAHHVVRLLGVVSRGTRPLVIMELMVRGDLKSFLRTTRDSSTSLTCSEMYRMAAEIADGMAYLAAKKFVHRDLAARNCMVSADRTVKIGDFGMTRDIYETDYYRKETHGLLPVRWMAPESLADGVFTSDSDVWSYGIVLWEIATLAEQPYQGLANEQVLQFVTAKGILERPLQCPDLLYDIMEVCWLWNPSSRPLFIDIVEKLEKNVGQDFRLVSFYHSREGEDFRMNKTEINKMRLTHNAAMAQGRIAAHWTRDSEEIRFHTEPASRSFNSMHSTSSISHSPPNNYTPYPSISSSAPRYGV